MKRGFQRPVLSTRAPLAAAEVSSKPAAFKPSCSDAGAPAAAAVAPGATSRASTLSVGRVHIAGINRQGTAAGISRSEATSAVGWARGGRPAALAPLPGDQESWAWGINSRGDGGGFSSGEAGTRAVLWPASRPHLGKKLPGDRRFAR
jgi:hypothetical protein